MPGNPRRTRQNVKAKKGVSLERNFHAYCRRETKFHGESREIIIQFEANLAMKRRIFIKNKYISHFLPPHLEIILSKI